MPSLGGFLKKKRTRDSNPETSNSTSPVAASSPVKSLFDFGSSSTTLQSPSSAHLHAAALPQTTAAAGTTHLQQMSPAFAAQQNNNASTTGSTNSTTTTTTTTTQQQQQQQPPPPQQPQQQQQQQYYAHNLPTIHNLINHQPQHDGVAVAASSTSPIYCPSPSPSKPAAAMKQENSTNGHSAHTNGASSSHQQHATQQQQHNQQQQQQQHHQQSQNQQQQSSGRTTKGKYSLGDFDLLRTLGTGSFGRVHLVQSKHNQRYYAVKVLKKAQVVKMKQVEHTNDERRMLSHVKHPFLITLWGTFQDCRNLYMVMDFVEGGELFSLLRKSGRFPNPVAKFYAAEVTLALEYLHSKNIIYRDLKPENLLLDRHGHIKITDFGFAKLVPDKTWTLCGTPDYLAPEVVSNRGYNKSVDWWSLGILIYEMLCGYTPFWDSGSPMRIYENILKGKVKYPAYVNADAQNLLEGLITADLTKRLGNLYAGPQDIKGHPWFAEVTWDRLARKDIDAPYMPPVKGGEGDSSQFDKYPEDPDHYGNNNDADEYGHLFTDF
ncbi:hypothetical protein CP532_4400 [Ophiocordyceps camponoti-leonardi (nom. inval.)]|nr:hypothetical protein CP532_4400 [Ophiocordyceps camponoti-leonardi (nom. inval.)]